MSTDQPVSDNVDNRSRTFRKANVSRRTVVRGAAWATPAIVGLSALPAWAASLTCVPIGTTRFFNNESRGRLLSGSIFDTNLDAVAALEGVHAQVLAANHPDSDTQNHPLSVVALEEIQLNLGPAGTMLSNLLDLNNDTAVLNQHAFAHTTGEARGASGAVANNGVIQFDDSSESIPELGSLNLKTVLEQLTNPVAASLVSQVADLNLLIGAVAGRAALSEDATEVCTPTQPSEVNRDHLLAYLKLVLNSDAVGDLLTDLPTLGTQISAQAVWDLLGTIPGLSGILDLLTVDLLNVSITVDTEGLVGTPLPANTGPNVPAQIELDSTELTVDLGALLGDPYDGDYSTFLNNLDPNTRLFIDAPLPTTAAADIIDDWVAALLVALRDVVEITITAGVTLGGPNLPLFTGLEISGSLGEFIDGDAEVVLTLSGVPVSLSAGNLEKLLLGVVGLVENGLKSLLADANILLSSLFAVLEEVLVLTVNAQNMETGTVPDDFATLLEGRFDVAALHLGAVGALDILDLFLGRGSVGPRTL